MSSTAFTRLTNPWLSSSASASTSLLSRGLDAARRVALVEREAELLEVVEDAAAQVEEDVLADAPGHEEEQVERRRVHHRDEQVGDDHER